MKAETFINAVGLIDDRHLIINTEKKNTIHHKWKRIAVSLVAAVALVFLPLPALTAFGVDRAYTILYQIAPSVAQTFKPVQKTCEDNGIEMTVISAECSGGEASVYLAMHDTTGACPYGEWDLYDSYSINAPRDMVGHCSFSEYDADTHTAYFVVHLETMDTSPIPKGKVTFSVHEMLLGKTETKSVLEDIDMSSIPYEPQTTKHSNINGSYGYKDIPDAKDYRFLLSQEYPLCAPAPNVSVMNIGYIDGALHILTRYEDNFHTDSHGSISLIGNGGKKIGETTEFGFYYSDDSNTDSYMEQIIPVSYDMLDECTLQGEFVSAQDYISGDWEVTFPIG
ncbi:MAG: hypothetical protein IJ740_10195 [Ruminococcus sp.]|nr:hypothetical protein [Ruminococcus sp.]